MPGTSRPDSAQVRAVGVQCIEHAGRALERVVAGLGASGVRRLAGDHDLEMQAAVVRGDDGVGETGADRVVGRGEALIEQPLRPDRPRLPRRRSDAARPSRRAAWRATSTQAGHRHRRNRSSTPPRRGHTSNRPGSRRHRDRWTSLARRHHVAMGVRGDRRSRAKALAHDQIGCADHAVRLHQALGHPLPLHAEPEIFEQCGRALGMSSSRPADCRRHLTSSESRRVCAPCSRSQNSASARPRSA